MNNNKMTLKEFIEKFNLENIDIFSSEALEKLYNYYQDNEEYIDVSKISNEWKQMDGDEIMRTYGEEYDFIYDVIDYLKTNTTIIEINNNNWLIKEF